MPPCERPPPLSTDPAPRRPEPHDPTADLLALTSGDVEVVGRLVDASNATLYVTVTTGARTVGAVYKPISGERPLWDFPDDTLGFREVASYRLAAWSGLDVVPATVLRDGPFGPGSVQLWVGELPGATGAVSEPGAGVVDVVPAGHVPAGWLTVLEATGPRGEDVVLCHADDDRLARMAVFDALANNADRKGGHILADCPERGGRVHGVDHGLTFHTDPKLRTVLWGWAGRRLPDDLLVAVERVAAAVDDGGLADLLEGLLDDDELRALGRRAQRLASSRRFPRPRGGGPAIPWPAF